jgi:demethylmenaquinone methyltransferase / 2-methoxy-6-polyprenyl-1,4-benzoquinol methylase
MDLKNRNNQTKVKYVRGLFSRISPNYDFMNRLMTFGMDTSWRRFLLSVAGVPRGGRLLDVGIGTGDIALEALRIDSTVHVTGVDYTAEMMEVGRMRDNAEKINWCRADAMVLPFPDATFDAVVSGFLVRNVADVRTTIREQVRAVKPGGRVVCLDTSPVRRSILSPFLLFYLKAIIPFLGWLLTGEGEAYRYLISSTMNFIKAETLADIMRDSGLEDVTFKRLMFGSIAVHWGLRPVNNQRRPITPTAAD